MSDAAVGDGSIVKIGATAIGEIVNANGPEGSRDAVDVSNCSSANGRKEFIPGLIDEGEVTCDINMTTTSAALLAAQRTATAQEIEVNYGLATTHKFTCLGFMTGWGNGIVHDGKLTQTVTIKLSGAATYA